MRSLVPASRLVAEWFYKMSFAGEVWPRSDKFYF